MRRRFSAIWWPPRATRTLKAARLRNGYFAPTADSRLAQEAESASGRLVEETIKGKAERRRERPVWVTRSLLPTSMVDNSP